MKRGLILALLLVAPGFSWAAPNTSQAEKYAWELSGKGTKPIECYFWVTRNEVSSVACQPLKHPTDDVSVILPKDAIYFYHTHPLGFPQLSEQDRAIERKTGIKIRVICHL